MGWVRMRKTILFLRHATAQDIAESDIQRPLSDHGMTQAQAQAATLGAMDITINHILCSAALRTRQTAAPIVDHLQCKISYIDALYDGNAQIYANTLREMDDAQDCVLLIGHNPSIAHCLATLCDSATEDQLFTALDRGYPPATLTLFHYEGVWADLAANTCALKELHFV